MGKGTVTKTTAGRRAKPAPRTSMVREDRAAYVSTPARVSASRTALSIKRLDALRDALDLPVPRMLSLLGMSRAAYSERRRLGKLNASESARVRRIERMLHAAVGVLQTSSGARAWLQAPQVGLNGDVPLALAVTDDGLELVTAMLGRIEHGVIY